MRGRPKKDDSRSQQYRVRLNDTEDAMLDHVSRSTGLPKSEIFRRAIKDYYSKVQLSEYAADTKEDDGWMDYHISLQRIVLCPHCGTQNRIDLEDYSVTTCDERQMGEEILYQFDVDEYECISCGQRFRISGYISEYPVGAFNSEQIDVLP